MRETWCLKIKYLRKKYLCENTLLDKRYLIACQILYKINKYEINKNIYLYHFLLKKCVYTLFLVMIVFVIDFVISRVQVRAKENSRRDRAAYLFARPTLPLIYFPLNFHHAFNNNTCITINLRGVGRPIKCALDYPDSDYVWRTSIRHPSYERKTGYAALHRRHRFAYVFRAVLTTRECYNQGSGLCAMRLWRFTGRIRLCALPRMAFPTKQSYKVVGKILLHLLKRYTQSFRGFFYVNRCKINP
jgi:hypothetical protein